MLLARVDHELAAFWVLGLAPQPAEEAHRLAHGTPVVRLSVQDEHRRLDVLDVVDRVVAFVPRAIPRRAPSIISLNKVRPSAKNIP